MAEIFINFCNDGNLEGIKQLANNGINIHYDNEIGMLVVNLDFD